MDDRLEELRKRAEVIMAAEAAQTKVARPSVMFVPTGASSPPAPPSAENPPVAQAAGPPARPPEPPQAVAAAAAPRRSNGRFEKGVSGNAKGRPKKRERAFTSSQVYEDVLSVMETPVSVRLGNGKATLVPPHLALWEQVVRGALTSSDLKYKLVVLDKYEGAIQGYQRSIPGVVEAIGKLETMLRFETDPGKRKDLEETLENFRRASRPGQKLG